MNIWFNTSEYEDRIIKKPAKDGKKGLERPIRVVFIDLPCVYHYNNELCEKFFGELAETQNYDIFKRKSIQKLIEFNYPLVKRWTLYKLFFPFNVFQFTLFFYLNFVFETTDYPLLVNLDYPL